MLFIPSFNPALGEDGLQSPGAKMAFYLTGTDTLADVFDSDGNPLDQSANIYGTLGVAADITGRFPQIYLGDEIEYRVVLRTAEGSQIGYEADPYTNIVQLFMSPEGASRVGYNQGSAGAIDQTVQDRLRQRVSVKDFGAVGDGTVDDTDAVQRMFDALGYIHFTPGRYKLVAKSASPYSYGNMASLAVYRAVDINGSNVSITGEGGATIYFVGYGTSNAVNYAFATAKNLTLGAISNVHISGLSFDFNPTGDSSINKRSFSLIGIERLVIEDCYLTSSGPRAGATITLQNCKTVRMDNMRWYNTTQGINLSYVEDLAGSNWQFNNFSEAVDFDRQVHGFTLSNLTFLGTGNNQQCMDMSSIINGSIDGVYAENVGNLFNIDYKPTSPLTYTEYVNNTTPTELTPSRNIVISNVSGKYVGADSLGVYGQSVITFGIVRSAAYQGIPNNGPCDNIAVRNASFTNSSMLSCSDVTNLLFDNVTLDGTVSPNSTSFGAITLSCNPTYAESEISGELRKVRIKNCKYKGVRISSPSKIVLDDVTVDGFNTTNTANMGIGVELTSLNTRQAAIYVDGTYIANGQTPGRGWQFSESGGGSFQSKLYWGQKNRIDLSTISLGIVFSTAGMQKRLIDPITLPLGSITLTSGQSQDFGLYYPPAKMGACVAWSSFTVTQNVSTDPSNFITAASRSWVSGVDNSVASYSGSGGITAAAETDLNLTYDETAVRIVSGDSFYMRFSAVGTGGTWNGVTVNLYVMPYQTS